jgi:hypothetical protein
MENKFNRSTVTDRDDLFSKRRLSAASARFYAKNPQRVTTDAEELIDVSHTGIVGNIPKIKGFLRNEHFSTRYRVGLA